MKLRYPWKTTTTHSIYHSLNCTELMDKQDRGINSLSVYEPNISGSNMHQLSIQCFFKLPIPTPQRPRGELARHPPQAPGITKEELHPHLCSINGPCACCLLRPAADWPCTQSEWNLHWQPSGPDPELSGHRHGQCMLPCMLRLMVSRELHHQTNHWPHDLHG